MAIQNFVYNIPSKILFGKGMVAELRNEIPQGSRVLLTYGGGSINANGIYDQVIEALTPFTVVEFGGIPENPPVQYLSEGVTLCKKHNINYILAVGGGSVIDGSKFISAAYFVDGDPWRLVSEKLPIEKTIPLGTVCTLPATSSEMNYISVISNSDSHEKYSFRDDKLFPQFTVIDPQHTFTLSKKQLGYAVCDAYMHVMEQYINTAENALFQDAVAESLLKILLKEGPKVLEFKEPNYDNRANLAWAIAWCLNGMIQCGVPTDLATHKIGHDLTAMYGITHAPSLIVAYPSVLRMAKKVRKEKMLQYAKNIWNISIENEDECMEKAIELSIQFFNKMGISNRFKDNNLPLEAIDLLTERFLSRGWNFIGNMQDIDVRKLQKQLKKDQLDLID